MNLSDKSTERFIIMLCRIYFSLLGVFALGLTTSCVSIDVEDPKIRRAQGVEVSEPNPPFSPFAQNHLDKAWKDSQTGNTISYLTECSDLHDPSHRAIRDGILSGISNATITDEEMIPFNQRQALKSTVIGSVDGISTQFEILILKKNNCIYVLTYVGMKNQFLQTYDHFSKFKKGFFAP